MVSEIMGGYGANLVIAIAAVAVALFLLFFVSRIFKNRGIAGRMRAGTGPRLAVLDSTPVDTSRRLVLIRRDDVEHLILIGGPSDLVVESRIERKREVPAAIVAAPSPELRQRQSLAAVAPAATRSETPATAASARPPVKGSEPLKTEPRQLVEQAPSGKPAEDVRQPSAENRSASSVSSYSTADTGGTDRSIEDVLDDARGRVFGSASEHKAMTAHAGHQKESPVQAHEEPKSSARFEDFLDSEIAGDLSAVTPGKAPAPAPSHADAVPRAEPAKRESPSIDSDMVRLLGELSTKR